MGFKVTVEPIGELLCSSWLCWFEICLRGVREEIWFANECILEQNLLLLKDQTAAYRSRLGVITNLNLANGHVYI